MRGQNRGKGAARAGFVGMRLVGPNGPNATWTNLLGLPGGAVSSSRVHHLIKWVMWAPMDRFVQITMNLAIGKIC